MTREHPKRPTYKQGEKDDPERRKCGYCTERLVACDGGADLDDAHEPEQRKDREKIVVRLGS